MNARNYPELLIFIFAGLIVFSIAFPLDRFSGTLPGHFLGIIGTLSFFATLLYSFRKRIRGKKGKANPLLSHVYFGLIGAILISLHASGRSSTIGMIIYIAMFLVVATGVVGRILFARLNRGLREKKGDVELLRNAFLNLKKQIDPGFCFRALKSEENVAMADFDDREEIDLAENGTCLEFLTLAESIAAKEEVLEAYERTKFFFGYWNGAHIYLSFFLFTMIIVHVLTTIFYGLRWLP